MERSLVGGEAVADNDPGDVADAEAQRGTGDGAVDGECGNGAPGGAKGSLSDIERVGGDRRGGEKCRGFGREFAGEPAGFALAAAVGTGVSRGDGDQGEEGKEQRSEGRRDTRPLGRMEAHHGKHELLEIWKKGVGVGAKGGSETRLYFFFAASSLPRNLAGSFLKSSLQPSQQKKTTRSGWPAPRWM